MSACEWCWTEASHRALLRGGSTAAHYHAVLDEQDALARAARCPEAAKLWAGVEPSPPAPLDGWTPNVQR